MVLKLRLQKPTLAPRLQTILANPGAQIIIILIYNSLLLAGYAINYLNLSFVPGWDGTSHASITRIFSEQIFPNLFGWIPNWNLGIPWPTGYPPIYSVLLAVGSRIFYQIDFDKFFKIFILAVALLIPVAVYFSALKIHRNKIYAFTSSILATCFLLLNASSYLTVGGGTYRATFQVGLYPQFIAMLVLILWIPHAFNSKSSILKHTLVNIFFVTALLLLNVHVAETAALIWICAQSYRAWITKKLFTTFLAGVATITVCLLLSAFWILPLIEGSSYLLSFADYNVVLGDLIKFNLIFFLLLGFTTCWAIYRKNSKIIAICSAALVILAASVLPLYQIFPGLPLQQNRLTPTIIALGVIVIPSLLSFNLPALSEILNKIYRGIITFILILTVILFSRPADVLVGGLSDITDNDRAMINFVGQFQDGRSLVESWYLQSNSPDRGFENRPVQSMVAGLLGQFPKHQTLWGVFRESSINMPFIQPVRNTFSPTFRENYGVYCYLCDGQYNPNSELYLPFYSQEFAQDIARSRLMGVKYFVVRSIAAKNQINANSKEFNISYVATFGDWEIFRDDWFDGYAYNPKFDPILTFAELKNRARGPEDFDWLRINEEWLFHADKEIVFARSSNPKIDHSTDLKYFKSIFVANFEYDSLEQAKQRLLNFATDGGHVFLLESDDPLLGQLKGLSENIVVIKKDKVRNTIQELISYARKFSEVTSKVKPSVDWSRNKIEIQSEALVPVVLKSSYFPWWEASNGSKIYMASPSTTLILPVEEVTRLSFQTSIIAQIGTITSLVTLVTIFTYIAIKRGLTELIIFKLSRVVGKIRGKN